MNYGKNDPDKLFRKASKQEPLLNETEVENLISAKGIGNASIFDKIINHIKGVGPMMKLSYAVAVAAVAGITGFAALEWESLYYHDDTDKIVKEQFEKANKKLSEKAKQNEMKEQKDASLIADNSGNSNGNVKEDKKSASEIIETSKVFEPIDINGIEPIELDEKDLEKLGIFLENGHDLKVFEPNSDKNSSFVLIKANGGVALNRKEVNNELFSLAEKRPILVTDLKGNKRFMRISNDEKNSTMVISSNITDDNTVLFDDNDNGGTMVPFEFDMDIESFNGDIEKFLMNIDSMNVDTENFLKVQDIDKENMQFFIRRFDDSASFKFNMPKFDSMDKRMVFIHKQIDSIKTDLDVKLKDVDKKRMKVRIERDKIRNSRIKNSDSNKEEKTFIVRNDNGDHVKWNTTDSVSINLLDNEIVQMIDPENPNIFVVKSKFEGKLNDSTIEEIEKVRGKMHKFNIDTRIYLDAMEEQKDALKKQKNSMVIMSHLDTTFSIDDQVMQRIEIVATELDEYAMFNKMIPIKIQSDKGNENGFIVWLEPDETLLEVLPQKYVNKIRPELALLDETDDICRTKPVAGEDTYLDIWKSCAGAIEDFTVFPNPTDGQINLKFELLEPRNVSISVHDLYGRRIYEVDGSQFRSKGNWDETYFLKDLESGMYLISLQTSKGEKAVQRVIVR